MARQLSLPETNEPLAVAGTAPATFEIKSATLPLVALLLKSADTDALARDFAARYGDIPEFFDQDALVIDLSRFEEPADIDFAKVVELVKRHRLAPLAVRGGTEAQIAAARAAGLFPAPDARIAQPAGKAQSDAKAEPAPAPAPEAMVVDKPLRGGQQVYAKGRDLVVLAMVNPGAEVIADGHIHVYAPLRGRAIAGARGNTAARIFSLALEPELISIAGVYRTGDAPLPDAIRGKPAQVKLASGPDGDRLVLEALRG